MIVISRDHEVRQSSVVIEVQKTRVILDIKMDNVYVMLDFRINVVNC